MRIREHLRTPHISILKRLSLLILLSLVYLLLFSSIFLIFHQQTGALISLLMLIPVTWFYGMRAGFFLLALNIFWTGFTLTHIAPEESSPLSATPLIGTALFSVLIVATGVFSKQNKRLKQEIEERNKAQDQLRQQQQHLEEIIAQRTAELEIASKRINRKEKLEAIGQLAGGVAHDFNNKLTIILGYCELLLKKLEKDSELHKYAEQIRISGMHSSELTRQLLAFARKGIYKSQVLNIHDIIGEVVALITPNLQTNINLSYSLKATRSIVWGGVSQIKSAILNLVLNAQEAMPDGGSLTINTENISVDDKIREQYELNCRDGAYVSVTVSDTGIGIAPDIRKHIFEPFFTTKTDGKGTGMGLAAVYGIVETHKGAIHVHSVLGQGSEFTLYFPLTKKKILATEAILRDELYSHNEHIFLIDDEILVAETIKTLLENIGYRVSLAFSGTEAIRIYKDRHPDFDIVMIDMAMPSMSGLETFRALKEINPAITAIITSGYAPNDEIAQSLDEGVQGFLQKPCDRYEMHILIQKVLGTKLLNSKNVNKES